MNFVESIASNFIIDPISYGNFSVLFPTRPPLTVEARDNFQRLLFLKWDILQENYFPNGVKATEDRFRNGIQDGVSRMFYRNGKKRREGRYVANVMQGVWTNWYEDGRVKKE